MGQLVTIEEIKRAMPQKKGVITQDAVDIINASLTDPEFQGESLLQTASTYEDWTPVYKSKTMLMVQR